MLSFDTLVLDFGDVLFDWEPAQQSPVPPQVLRHILQSSAWFQFEKGLISQDECYSWVGREFDVPVAHVHLAFKYARESLTPNASLITLIQDLKLASLGELKVYAMSNISSIDYAYLRSLDVPWSIFDDIFVSCDVGERKPQLGFFRTVFQKTGRCVSRTLFVDDKLDNVLSARALGWQAIQYTDRGYAARVLRGLLSDPVYRGHTFLVENSGSFDSVTETGVIIQENFAQLLLLEISGQKHLVKVENLSPLPDGTYRFFKDESKLTTEDFPPDLDTTSLALTILPTDTPTIESVLVKMLKQVDSDGITQTYFDSRRPRVDPVVCANTVSLFYRYGRQAEVQCTIDYLFNVLKHRAYLFGTRYYSSPECFLFFVMRLLEQRPDGELQAIFGPLLVECLRERIGLPGDALALAMRLFVGYRLGIQNNADLFTLRTLQLEDGSWPSGFIYKYGSTGLQIGSVGLTTALAIQAIRLSRNIFTRSHSSGLVSKAIQSSFSITQWLLGLCTRSE